MPGFDCGLARHHVQQRIEQIAAVGLLIRLVELFGKIFDKLQQISFYQHDGIAIQQHGLTSKLPNSETELREHFAVLEQQRGFLGSQLDGLRH